MNKTERSFFAAETGSIEEEFSGPSEADMAKILSIQNRFDSSLDVVQTQQRHHHHRKHHRNRKPTSVPDRTSMAKATTSLPHLERTLTDFQSRNKAKS